MTYVQWWMTKKIQKLYQKCIYFKNSMPKDSNDIGSPKDYTSSTSGPESCLEEKNNLPIRVIYVTNQYFYMRIDASKFRCKNHHVVPIKSKRYTHLCFVNALIVSTFSICLKQPHKKIFVRLIYGLRILVWPAVFPFWVIEYYWSY